MKLATEREKHIVDGSRRVIRLFLMANRAFSGGGGGSSVSTRALPPRARTALVTRPGTCADAGLDRNV